MVSVVVERARKCLDFASTIYILHFLITWLFFGFPSNWEWWVVNVVSMIAMVVLSEYLCLRKEMMDIPRSEFITTAPNKNKSSNLPV